ncbi:shikimate kinase [Paractinoplanes atraurantiacus]|uniref:Cytidylate kinase n=1 Tax=Paractinoplanes atraurantiacus TaxID=1036182 RepID=A0A285IAQ6_9ACTN|nr:shikimate kinase [Actinoplanes atraurantiacus]SNY45030.1 Cytidylate kinase [Actinoplanes atraurantiacus]
MSLSHVFWIGGASGAGKSTVARVLSARHGLHLYDTDAVMGEHAARSTEAQITAFKAMTMDQRWVERSPQTMLETFHWYRGEAFDQIIADLRGLPAEPGIIAEGFRLLPHLVRPHLPDQAQAVWLLPTPGFRRAAFDSRGSTWRIAGRTSDPERALANLLERDRLFTERLRDEVTRENLPAITVTPGMTEEELTEQVSHCLKIHRVR